MKMHHSMEFVKFEWDRGFSSSAFIHISYKTKEFHPKFYGIFYRSMIVIILLKKIIKRKQSTLCVVLVFKLSTIWIIIVAVCHIQHTHTHMCMPYNMNVHHLKDETPFSLNVKRTTIVKISYNILIMLSNSKCVPVSLYPFTKIFRLNLPKVIYKRSIYVCICIWGKHQLLVSQESVVSIICVCVQCSNIYIKHF